MHPTPQREIAHAATPPQGSPWQDIINEAARLSFEPLREAVPEPNVTELSGPDAVAAWIAAGGPHLLAMASARMFS